MSIRSLFVCVALVATIGCSPNGNTESSVALTVAAVTAPDSGSQQTLFTNVRVWDGVSEGLTDATNVLVVNNLIHSIGSDGGSESATVIDGAGRTLMPGLIEGHGHLQMNGASITGGLCLFLKSVVAAN